VVQQPLGTPRFQAQKHQLKIIKNSKRFDPPKKKIKNTKRGLRRGPTLGGDEQHQEEDQHYGRTSTRKKTITNKKGGVQFIKSHTKESCNTKGSSRTPGRGLTLGKD
jgi:hypothetical protein